MWKRVLITFSFLIIILTTIVLSNENLHAEADSSEDKYINLYDEGNTFKLGNDHTYEIMHTDQSTGKSILRVKAMNAGKLCVTQNAPSNVLISDIENCIPKLITDITSDQEPQDEFAKWIMNINQNYNFSNIDLASMDLYEKIYLHGKILKPEFSSDSLEDISNLKLNFNSWVKDKFPQNHYVFIAQNEFPIELQNIHVRFQDRLYPYFYKTASPGASLPMDFFLEGVNVPQKNQLKELKATVASLTAKHLDSSVTTGATISELSTVEGEGAFEYSIDSATLTNADGSTADAKDFFKLSLEESRDDKTTTNGKGKLLVSDSVTDLDSGEYEITIKVVDKSTNVKLYRSEEDEKRTTSKTIKISVSKGKYDLKFTNPDTSLKTIGDAQKPWIEKAESTTTLNDKVKLTYELAGGDSNVITIDSDTGAITPISNSAKGRVSIKATIDDNPSTGKDNYDETTVTKDIIIVNGVDGSVVPDDASSDTIVPIFKASDANIKSGGTIATIIGSDGFYDDMESGTITYTYTLKTGENSTYFKLDKTSGKLTSNVNLAVGTYNVTVIVADKWSSKDIPIKIEVKQISAETLKFFLPTDKTTVITSQTVKVGDKNVKVFAEVKGSTNTNIVNYKLKDGAPSNIVSVHPTTGAITIKNVGTTTIQAVKKGITGQADAIANLTITVKAADQTFIYCDAGGSELSKNSDGTYQSYKQNGSELKYSKNGSFQLYTAGSPSGSLITFALKDGSPTDVVTVSKDGLVKILNASTTLQTNKVVVTATSHDLSGKYVDKTIELPINIMKATPKISFKEIMNVANGEGSIEPLVNDMNISSSAGGANINDTKYIIHIDNSFDSSIAWTKDGKTIQYSYKEANAIDVPLVVTKPGNRNYETSEAKGKLHIVGLEDSLLEVSTPGKITYGDTFTIRSLQDDTSSKHVKYTFTLANTTYVKGKTQTNNQMSFEAIKVSGTTEIEIKVERSADGELPLSKTVKVKVLPKEVTIKLDDKERISGESNPAFTYQDFASQLVSWNGVKDSISASDLKISSPATQTSSAGSYPITLDVEHLNKTYPNYKFKAGKATLTIKATAIKDDWYHLEKNDGTSYKVNTWVNQDVFIKSDRKDYLKLSTNKQVWEDHLKVSTEGKTSITFYMKNASNAIAGSKTEVVLIDKTAPKITSIKGKEAKASSVQTFLNSLTFNAYYKAGINMEIQAEDMKPDGVNEVSDIANIQYKVYDKNSKALLEDKNSSSSGTLSFVIPEAGEYNICAIATDKAGNKSPEKCQDIVVKKINVDVDEDGKNDFIDSDNDGCPDINIVWKNEDNTWTKLNVDRNGDNIPDLNIDSDGDGKADLNIDSDNDGLPDLNLVILSKTDWKPSICVTSQPEEYCTGTSAKPQINIDNNKDGIPDINIDTDGDMKADINITKPNETKPIINITSTHSKWEPKTNYKAVGFAYDTDSTYKAFLNVDSDNDGRPDLNIDFDGDGKPDINIDANGDGIPETDIDGDGDGKPDVNVDTNKDGKPDKDVVEITKWEPKADVEKDGFAFDTMTGIVGKDQLEDNNVIVTKPGGIFLPNFAIKVDKVTDSVSEDLKNDIILKSNGQIIEDIYDVKFLKNNVRVQPDGTLKVQIPLSNNLKNPYLVIEQKDGSYVRVKPEIKDGCLFYESDYLGKVVIVKDATEDNIEPGSKPDNPSITPNEPTPDTGGSIEEEVKKPQTSNGGNNSGANTGDDTNAMAYIVILIVASGVMIAFRKRKTEK